MQDGERYTTESSSAIESVRMVGRDLEVAYRHGGAYLYFDIASEDRNAIEDALKGGASLGKVITDRIARRYPSVPMQPGR